MECAISTGAEPKFFDEIELALVACDAVANLYNAQGLLKGGRKFYDETHTSLIGAFRQATPDDEMRGHVMLQALVLKYGAPEGETTGTHNLVRWNDAPERTRYEVIRYIAHLARESSASVEKLRKARAA